MGEGYPPLLPPTVFENVKFCCGSTHWEHIPEVYIYLFLPSNDTFFPDRRGIPISRQRESAVVERLGVAARGKRSLPPSLLLINAYTYMKTCR